MLSWLCGETGVGLAMMEYLTHRPVTIGFTVHHKSKMLIDSQLTRHNGDSKKEKTYSSDKSFGQETNSTWIIFPCNIGFNPSLLYPDVINKIRFCRVTVSIPRVRDSAARGTVSISVVYPLPCLPCLVSCSRITNNSGTPVT